MTIFKSIDPATEATNWEGEAASPAQVQSAVARTQDAPTRRTDKTHRQDAPTKDSYEYTIIILIILILIIIILIIMLVCLCACVLVCLCLCLCVCACVCL